MKTFLVIIMFLSVGIVSQAQHLKTRMLTHKKLYCGTAVYDVEDSKLFEADYYGSCWTRRVTLFPEPLPLSTKLVIGIPNYKTPWPFGMTNPWSDNFKINFYISNHSIISNNSDKIISYIVTPHIFKIFSPYSK